MQHGDRCLIPGADSGTQPMNSVTFLGQNLVEIAVDVVKITVLSLLLASGAPKRITSKGQYRTFENVAFGMAILGLAIAVSYAFLDVIQPGLYAAYLVAAMGALRVLYRSRPKLVRLTTARENFTKLSKDHIKSFDVPLVLLLLCLTYLPSLKWGSTYVTRLVNDLPNYAASVDIWRFGSESFRFLHPDNFGTLQLSRAAIEKPFVTGLFSGWEEILDTETLKIFPALFLLSTVISIKALRATLRSHIPNVYLATLFSTIPFLTYWHALRVVDSQPGHVISVMFLCLVLQQVAEIAGSTRLKVENVVKIVFFFSSGLMANPTLFTTAIPTALVVGLALWSTAEVEWSFKQVLRNIEWLLCLLPLVAVLATQNMMRSSIRIQTGNSFGFPSDFPTPLFFFGLDQLINPNSIAMDVLGQWLTVLGAGLVAVIASRSVRRFLSIGFILSAVLTTLLIGLRLGFSDYAMGKWLSVLVVLAVPFSTLLKRSSSLSWDRKKTQFALLGIFVVLFANIYGTNSRFDGRINVLPPQAFEFDVGPPVGDKTILNLELSNLYRSSAWSLILEDYRTVITERTYAAPTPPVGELFVIEPETFDERYEEIVAHPDGNTLIVRRDSSLSWDYSTIDSASALHRLVAYPKGEWSMRESAIVSAAGPSGGIRISIDLEELRMDGQRGVVSIAGNGPIDLVSYLSESDVEIEAVSSESGVSLTIDAVGSDGQDILEIWLVLENPSGEDLAITQVQVQ